MGVSGWEKSSSDRGNSKSTSRKCSDVREQGVVHQKKKRCKANISFLLVSYNTFP